MNIASSTSTGSALDALTSALARRKATAASDGDAAYAAVERPQRPPPPPPPGGGGPAMPSAFDMSQQSTTQFAGMRADPGNPIAQLDTDGDGAVSADEFGLDGAGSDVQQLFSAIDSDGDGSLSSCELSDFDTKMREAAPPQPDEAAQVQQMLQRIAQGYLSLTGSETPAGTLSATA